MDAPAERLGPYELLARAGAGGMGVVYRARYVETGAEHALKVLLPGGDADDVLRFRREAEAMARVDGHPGVARVHAVGEDRGRLWIAMEWAPGGTLADRLEGGPLALDEAVALGRDLTGALAHVHARGALHRDLKPQNVLYGEDGAPRLTDFGLARLRGARSLTETGVVLGTPVYMAPEQADGGKQADERTDVYGLGALLYHALTGRPPFKAGSALATLRAVLEEAPPAPRSLRPELPAWLEQVVLRALAKRPDDRWPSARALAEALEAGPAGARAARRPLALVVVAALVVMGVGAGAAVVARRRGADAPPAPPIARRAPLGAELEAALGRDDLARASALALEALTSAPPVERAKVVAQAAALLEQGELARLERLLAPSLAVAEPPAVALVLAGEVALARDRHPVALELARRAIAAEATAEARWLLGRALVAADELDEAGQVLRSVLGRGAAAHALLELEAARRRLQGVVAFWRAYEQGDESDEQVPAQAASLVEAMRVVGEELAAGLAVVPGSGVAVRLQRTVLALDGLLLRLVRRRALPDDVDEVLRAVAAAAPGSDGRTLELLALCTRAQAMLAAAEARDAQVSRAEASGLAEALLAASHDAPPRYRLLALALRMRLLPAATQGTLAELARAELALAMDTDAQDHLRNEFGSLRERVVDGYVLLAWRDPDRRRAALVRALALCARAPYNPHDGGLPRERLRAALMAGDPTREGFDRMNEVDRPLFAAELALMAGDAAAAEATLSSLLAGWAEGRLSKPAKRGDALCALAVARALRDDFDGARVALDEAGRSGGGGWLPWRELELTRRTLALIEAEDWRPRPGVPFPPQLAPGGRW